MKMCCREQVFVVLSNTVFFLHTRPFNVALKLIRRVHERIPSLEGTRWGSSACPDPDFKGLCILQALLSSTFVPFCSHSPVIAPGSNLVLWVVEGKREHQLQSGRKSHYGAIILSASLGSPDPHRDVAAIEKGLPASALFREHELVPLEPLHGHAILGGWCWCYPGRSLPSTTGDSLLSRCYKWAEEHR